jgi:G3E family GTPase
MNSQSPLPSPAGKQPVANKKVTVFIITGFLGAGKTTLLNNLLSQFEKENNFIIENEFGQVNIDKNLVSGNFEKIYEITNGCLCCNLDSDLYSALDQIARMEQLPDNLFIETTGIADAGNLSAIFHEEFVQEIYNLNKIICMVDVEVIEDFLEKTSEAARQIIASDLLVLNKSNRIDPKYMQQVGEMVKKLNPYAHIIFSPDGTLDKARLSEPNPTKPLFAIDMGQSKTKSHDISTVFYETEGEFDIEKLEILLRTSLYIYYQDIYRIKGYVKNGSGEVYLLQSAGKTLSVTKTDEAVSKSYLVFIGRKLTTEIAHRLLHSALVKK